MITFRRGEGIVPGISGDLTPLLTQEFVECAEADARILGISDHTLIVDPVPGRLLPGCCPASGGLSAGLFRPAASIRGLIDPDTVRRVNHFKNLLICEVLKYLVIAVVQRTGQEILAHQGIIILIETPDLARRISSLSFVFDDISEEMIILYSITDLQVLISFLFRGFPQAPQLFIEGSHTLFIRETADYFRVHQSGFL